MRWISTRGAAPPATFREALFSSTAPDGGLYVPERIDRLPGDALASLAGAPLPAIGAAVAAPLLAGELAPGALAALLADALDFPVPLVPVHDGATALELFHGPTLAFKDVGARVMARLFAHFADRRDITVLVATSGDTGSAVAHAFAGVAGTRVIVLYPAGQVSDVQEAQMATLGGNVTAAAVDGTFDDCQALVKRAFGDRALRQDVALTSANSINIGRLLPQVFYYFLLPAGAVVSVPSGNFGNLTAGLIAKRMGAPIVRFVAATNVNDVVPRFLATGRYEPEPSRRTVANAMDVGAPSNLERIRTLYADDREAIARDVRAASFTDEAIVAAIRDVYDRTGYLLDPHGAVAYLGLAAAAAGVGPAGPGIFLGTAHPAKFREVVEPAIGAPVPLPPVLTAALARPRRGVQLRADYDEFVQLCRL